MGASEYVVGAPGPEDEANQPVNEANQIVSIVTTMVRNTRRNAGL